MIQFELKENPEINYYYDTFEDFERSLVKWYKLAVNPGESAMEYVMRNYNVYIGAKLLTV